MTNRMPLIFKIIAYVILTAGAVTMLLPFVWMFLTSFKTFAETMQVPIVWIPRKFTLDNFQRVLSRFDFARYYMNTIIVSVGTTVLQLTICSLAAFSFGRLKYPGRDKLFFLILSVLMVPGQLTLIPKYNLMIKLGWINTFKALIIPGIFSAYGTFFLRQFYMTIPIELDESAKIDGCSPIGIYLRIVLPLTRNALIALGIFTLIGEWNELLWPLIVTNKESMRLLSTGVALLVGEHLTEYNIYMAAAVLATAPMIFVYILAQKYIIDGVAITGIKA